MENQNQYLKHILLEFQSAEKWFLLYVLNEIKKFNLKHSILQIKLQRSFTKKEKLFYEFLNHFNNFNSKNSLKKNIFFWNELWTIFYNELYFNCNLLIYQFLWKAFNELNSRYLWDTISYQYIENLSFSNLYHNLEECEDKVSFWWIHSTAHRQFWQLLDWINFFEKMLNNFEKNKKLQKEFKYFIYLNWFDLNCFLWYNNYNFMNMYKIIIISSHLR